MVGIDQLKENLLKPGFALKSGGAKRSVFTSAGGGYDRIL